MTKPEVKNTEGKMEGTVSKIVKSPYALSTKDDPENVITRVVFDGRNYEEWVRKVSTGLRAKRKLGFIDGTVKYPGEGSEEEEDWLTVNAMVTSWIFNTIDPKLRSSITHRENAKELWDSIKARFSAKSEVRVQQLKEQLMNCKQRDMSLETYYGRLQVIWEDLSNYEFKAVCSCGGCKCQGCSCDFVRQLETAREKEKLHQFCLGLDASLYGNVRTAIVNTDPLPSIDHAYSMVAREEQMRSSDRDRVKETRGEAVAFAVNTGGTQLRGDSRGRGSVCTHCNKTGHDAGTCYQLHGYPEWWLEKYGKGRGKPSQGGGVTSSARNKVGNGRGAIVNTVSHVTSSSEGHAMTGLNKDQWDKLVRLLGEKPEEARLTGKSCRDDWIVDSGASHHMTGAVECLFDVHTVTPCLVGLPNGKLVIADQEGSVALTDKMTLHSVLFVKELKCNLISVSQLIDELNCIVLFSKTCCLLQDLTLMTPIGVGRRKDGVYFLQEVKMVSRVKKVDAKEKESLELWHKRLGHASHKRIRQLPVVDSSGVELSVCDICFRAKQCRSEFPLSINKSNEIFELIHVDLWGPYRTQSLCGSYYFLTVVDDFSRGVWVFLLTDKTQVQQTLKDFLAMVSRQFSKEVKIIRSDNGTEFTSMRKFFSANGIVHQTSCVGTPQQNGRVERKHRHILNIARALMFQGKFSTEFWGECVLAAAHLINRTPCEIHKGKTPYEIIFGSAPSYGELKVIGCLAYAHNQKRNGDKFASRSRRCVFVGYPYAKKGWTLFDLDTREIFVSRDVTFVEGVFPYSDVSSTAEDIPYDGNRLVDLDAISFDDEDDEGASTGAEHVSGSLETEHHENNHDQTAIVTNEESTKETTEKEDDNVITEDTAVEATQPVEHDSSVAEPIAEARAEEIPVVEMGRGLREKKPSTRLQDYVLNTVQRQEDYAGGEYEFEFDSLYGIEQFLSCDKFSAAHTAFLAAVTDCVEPKSFAEVMKDERWRNAASFEINALEESGTWTVEHLPPGKHAIGCKWIFKIKFNADGTIERFKARLVALGNKQVEGIDYFETFAPVVKMTTVRTFLRLACGRGWDFHQMDVHNAFLHGDLDEEVFMKLPPGFHAPEKGMVCRLRKSLYGLKQSPRCWFSKFAKALLEYGFVQCGADHSLFSLITAKKELHLLIYVDDLVLTGSSHEAIQDFKTYLSNCFHMKDLGKLKYFLGIEVARSQEGLFLSQRKYALDILADVGLLGGRPVEFPIEQNHQLGKSTAPLLSNPQKYRRLVGRLIYLTATRPDLAYAVHTLSQFMQQPTLDHWDAGLRVVRYLKGSPGQGILLKSDRDFQLTAWTDSDWAGCPLTRRSVSGWLVQLGDSPISWRSRKQDVVSRSSAEAEYRAMVEALCELKWIKNVLHTMGVGHRAPMNLYCDSRSALHIAANPVFHERTKHVELDCHFIRDDIQRGVVKTKHVSTLNQLADIFTKALGGKVFQSFLFKLGIRNLHAPT